MTDMHAAPGEPPVFGDMADDGVSARGDQRDSLFLQAEIWCADAPEAFMARVRNLSPGGLLAESPIHVAEGTALRVTLPNIGMIAGRCVWSGENRFGVAFASEIDPQAARRKIGSRTDVPRNLIDMTLHTSRIKRPLRPV
jgi:hypothetical protein